MLNVKTLCSIAVSVALFGCGGGHEVTQDTTYQPPVTVVLPTITDELFSLREDNTLVNEKGEAVTDSSGNDIKLVLDNSGNPIIGESGGYVIIQTDGDGNEVENEIFFNTEGELWVDGNGDLVTKKVVSAPGSEEDSTPSPEDMVANLVGFNQVPRQPSPVLFMGIHGHHYFDYRHTITAATNEGTYMILGGHKSDYYIGDNPVQRIDLATEQLESNDYDIGILTTSKCLFDEELVESLFDNPPTLDDIHNSPELGCLPGNARQFASSSYVGLSAILTKKNELWGVGFNKTGLGGKLLGSIHYTNKLTLPVKIADDVKKTTLYNSESYAYKGVVLTNSGEVFYVGNAGIATDKDGKHVSATSPDAVNGGFIKLKTPEDDFIINVQSPGCTSDCDFAVAVGASGQYYILESDKVTPLNLTNKDVLSALRGIKNKDGIRFNFVNNDGKSSVYDVNSGETRLTTAIFYDSDDTLKNNPQPLSDVVFEKLVSDGVLKGIDGNYYAMIWFYNSYLAPEFSGYWVKLKNNLGPIKFIEENPNYEFSFADSRVLINKKIRK